MIINLTRGVLRAPAGTGILCHMTCDSKVLWPICMLLLSLIPPALAKHTFRVVTNDTGEVFSYRQVSRPDHYVQAAPSKGLWEAYAPPMGVYKYAVRWKGKEVGRVTLTLTDNAGTNVAATLYAQSLGAVKKLSNFSFSGESLLTTNSYQTIDALLIERQRKRKRTSNVRFYEDGRVTSFRRKVREGGKTRESRRELTAGEWTHDPLSLAMTLRGLRWEPGMSAELEVFDGDDLYAVDLTCTGKTIRSVNGRIREAWVLVPVLQKLDATETPDPDDAFEHKTELYIATDASRDFLGGKSETPVGEVDIKLRDYRPPRN